MSRHGTPHDRPLTEMRFAEFLQGIRVIDLCHYIPGPLASLTLSDMGAEVLKVEPPQGDGMRHLGPRGRDGQGLFYETINAGKSVLELDLKSQHGRSRFLDLVADADVVLEGFRPGATTRLGVDYESLRTVNSRLVYCSISGYGATGSLAEKAGHDANYLAEAGVLDRNGSDRPVYFDPPIADAAGGLYAAIAILGALMGRARTGLGARIDLGLADVAMPLQLLQVADFGARGFVPSRGQTYLNGGAAFYNVYATADGHHVVIGAVEPKFWSAFCGAAGRPEWIGRQGEAIPQFALIADVSDYFTHLTIQDCDARFAEVDCCYSRVATLDEAIASRHVSERQLVRRVDESRLQALFPAWVDGVPPTAREPLQRIGPGQTVSSRRPPSGQR